MPKKKIRIIYHNDFDGVISAGIFSRFLKWHYDTDLDFKYQSIDYDKLGHFHKSDPKEEFAILDFPYHPKASWWFDHHTTSFATKKLQARYYPSMHRYWSTRYKSCPALLFAFFKKKYPEFYHANFSHFKNMIAYSNIIDSAQYATPHQAYDFKNPYIYINTLLEHNHDRKIHTEIITEVSEKTFDLYLESETIRRGAQKAHKNFKTDATELRKRIKVQKKIAIFNLLNDRKQYKFSVRYIPYYFYPELDYVITMDMRYGRYYLGLSRNPWKGNGRVHVGILMSKFSGGGRRNVGAVLLKSAIELNTAVEKIQEKLTGY